MPGLCADFNGPGKPPPAGVRRWQGKEIEFLRLEWKQPDFAKPLHLLEHQRTSPSSEIAAMKFTRRALLKRLPLAAFAGGFFIHVRAQQANTPA